MADLTLAIANKAYSSWSLRAWLALRQTGAAFDEVVVPLRESNTRSEIMKYSPSAKLPALIDGEVTVWESLAIVEYLAEKFPEAGLWPEAAPARAYARAIASEMHGGFIPLRRALPMNLRHSVPGLALEDPVKAEVLRIQAIWRDARKRFGTACGEGPFLMGAFSAVDAMYAPIAARFSTYQVDLEAEPSAYADAVMDHPDMREWIDAARSEPWIIDEFELEPGKKS